MSLFDSFPNCARCGAPGAHCAGYAGILCASCDAALAKVCDFCGRPPAWRYPVASFVALGVSRSTGDWLACERCHRLVEARRFLALRDLAVKAIAKKHPEARADKGAARRLVAELHGGFFAHREGDAFRIDH